MFKVLHPISSSDLFISNLVLNPSCNINNFKSSHNETLSITFYTLPCLTMHFQIHPYRFWNPSTSDLRISFPLYQSACISCGLFVSMKRCYPSNGNGKKPIRLRRFFMVQFAFQSIFSFAITIRMVRLFYTYKKKTQLINILL